MKPIMALQNSKLGFLTDKKDSQYPEKVVKECLIDAVLTGFQPYGNQFNIIKGNMYGTKEGFGYVLNKVPGLRWTIIPSLPRIDKTKWSAAVVMKIQWSFNLGPVTTEEIDFGIMIDEYTAKPDTVIGKATRKARAWLFEKVTGIEVGDADLATEPQYTVIDAYSHEELCASFEKIKDRMDPDDYGDSKRILDNKETTNYKKLKTQIFSKYE
jgi:hypothetical protein